MRASPQQDALYEQALRLTDGRAAIAAAIDRKLIAKGGTSREPIYRVRERPGADDELRGGPQ